MKWDSLRRMDALVVGGVIVAFVGGAALLSTAGDDDDAQPVRVPSVAPLPPRPPAVVYEVDGDAEGADLTIQTPTGTSQREGAAVPLKRESADDEGLPIPGFRRGDFVYISAQNTAAYGELTCRIRVDGLVISENTATGAYAIATCQGQA